MPRILLLANHPAMNRNIIRWAVVLRERKVCEPVLFSTSGDLRGVIAGMGVSGDLPVLYPAPGLGWAVAAGSSPHVAIERPSTVRGRLKALLPGPVESAARHVLFAYRTLANVRTLRRQVRYVRALIREQRIEAVLLSESSPAYDAPVFIKAAKAERIPVVTAPIDHYGRLDHAELYLTNQLLAAEAGINRLAAGRYPRWEVKYKGRRLLRVQPELLLAQEWLGMASPEPWRMIGAWEDAVVVTGAAMRDFFVTDGVDAGLLEIVGSPELDIAAQAVESRSRGRAELHESLGLDGSKPLILSALVANHYLSGRPDAEYEKYGELIEGWVRPLGEIEGYNVVISLHPSQSIEEFRYIEAWGVKISQRDITQLIPFSDMYVACSSTARLAIACGMPVVYYDVFRYSLAMPALTFGEQGGTFVVLTRADYLAIVNRLAGDPVFFADAARRQRESAAYWGPLDGKSADRLSHFLTALAERSEWERRPIAHEPTLTGTYDGELERDRFV